MSPSAEPGSGSCKPRPPCTDKDFFYTHTACDADGQVMRGHPGVVPLSLGVPTGSPAPPGQTQLMYKWAEPKICSEELPQAARLPLSGVKTRCPPCNPGFAKGNGSTCQPCPYGSYSNGSGKAAPSLPPERYWSSPSCRGEGGCHSSAGLSPPVPMAPIRTPSSLSPGSNWGPWGCQGEVSPTSVQGCPILSLSLFLSGDRGTPSCQREMWYHPGAGLSLCIQSEHPTYRPQEVLGIPGAAKGR